MCGLLGTVTRRPFDERRFDAAAALQAHRGPDGHGAVSRVTDEWHVLLGHQRLAIIDLSPTGAQPMIHPHTGSVLVYNGEMYNYIELRGELEREGVTFNGTSDTEVLLNALEHWGIERTLRRMNGMWSFAWLDVRKRKLCLSRDRCGEKPLYFTRTPDGLLFASELRTLLALHDELPPFNMQTLGEFIVQGLLNAGPDTFFEGVSQIRPGTFATFDLAASQIEHAESDYWTCPVDEPRPLAWEAFVETVRERLVESVRIRLRSDVPVGVLLSGGLDSSSIVGAAMSFGADNLTLLSSVSDDSRFDESPFIDRVAGHAGWPIEKIRLPAEPDILFGHLHDAIAFADAPLHDLSNVAHYLLMKAARERGITVILSGQGADELLCGYRKFLGFHVLGLLRDGRHLQAVRTLLEFSANGTVLSQFSWADARRYLPKLLRPRQPEVLGPALRQFIPRNVTLKPGESLSLRQQQDLLSLSVPKLNHTEDRMSMAWSREIRLPYLDPGLIELILPAPPAYKLAKGWTKYALRCAVAPFLPPEIVWRKDKQGFVNPQSEWLKRQLRPLILADYLRPDSHIFRLALYDRPGLLQLYDRFCSQPPRGGGVWARDILTPVGTEIWLRRTMLSSAS